MTQEDLFEWKNPNRRITGESLPEIAADHIVLIWDQDLATHEIVIRFGEREIHRESAGWEYYEFFMESCKAMRRKYGNRLYDVVPTERTYQSLWGDKLSAPEMIEEFRKRLRMASRIEDRMADGEMGGDRWSEVDFDVSEYDSDEESLPTEAPTTLGAAPVAMAGAEMEVTHMETIAMLFGFSAYSLKETNEILAAPIKTKAAIRDLMPESETTLEIDEEDEALNFYGNLTKEQREAIKKAMLELYGPRGPRTLPLDR